MEDIKNLLLAVGLSLLVFYLYEAFYAAPLRDKTAVDLTAHTEATPSINTDLSSVELAPPEEASLSSTVLLKDEQHSEHVAIDSPRLKGGIALKGAQIDQIVFKDYFDTVGPGAKNIELFHPDASKDTYTAEFGWRGLANGQISFPDANTLWRVEQGTKLTAQTPVTLVWDNGQGLIFRQTYSIDENFLIAVEQTVKNTSGQSVVLAPYGRILRLDTPKTLGFMILHEGPLGVFENKLTEIDYDELVEAGKQEFKSIGGWLGFTDKYWLAALIPDQTLSVRSRFVHQNVQGREAYQANYVAQEMSIDLGAEARYTARLFAGAKEVSLLDAYEESDGIPLFSRAIDWGWFYFLTRPIFYFLHLFYGWVGNFGVAILLLTVIIKAILYPLADKSYRAMSRMKKLQPMMKDIQERYKNDRLKQQQEMMALYQREKVNPAAGCLPILVQIPVFFALYKVLFITIEMRQAPFYGWIKDLSAPDPLTFITAFGLISWDVPSYLSWLAVGIWPILMGLTMWLQMKLNPQSPDPIQSKIFAFMPVLFTFILASFPVGLVIYWTWNNILSIVQQWIIMKREGVSITV